MFARNSRHLAAATLLCLVSLLSTPAGATVTFGGDPGQVEPALAYWPNEVVHIGFDPGKSGTVTVAGGSHLTCNQCLIATNYAMSSGTVTVTDPGSTWTNSYLYVGDSGHGALNVTNGGQVITQFNARCGNQSSAVGTAIVSGTGSTWTSGSLYVDIARSGSTLTVSSGGTVTTGTLYASPDVLRGDGTINTKGIIADTDLAFDATNGTSQIFSFGSGGVLNLNADGTGALGAGCAGTGTLTVTDGLTIASSAGYFGYQVGSNGTGTITGAGSTWRVSSGVTIGQSGVGRLTMSDGGKVSSRGGTIGASVGSTGTVIVTGADSSWTSTNALSVGYSGTGTLAVANGGKVIAGIDSSTVSLYLGYDAGSSGTLAVTGPGSNWTGSGYLGVGYTGTGTLSVTNGGTVKTSYGSTLGAWSGSTGTATVSGPGSAWTNSSELYVGRSGNGKLRVDNGGTVSNSSAYIGSATTSNSAVTITGLGSTWNNSNMLYVGGGENWLSPGGTGTLMVEDGGKVTCKVGNIGYKTGSSGTATVTGTGSTWTNSGSLYVGYPDAATGTLTAGHGGKVTAQSVTIGGASIVNLQVSVDGMLVLGNAATAGSIANSGKVNLYADAFLAAQTYSPITEFSGKTMTWSGTGSYNAYGGAWDDTAKTLTVAAAVTSDSAGANTLTTGERLLITDSGTGKRVGASFGTVAAGTNFSAAVLSGVDLIGLPADQTVLGAWNFITDFAGDQALLSFDIGAGQTGTLSVWHYDGSTWTPFAAPDLTYGDDGIANFAVTSFSGYAVTAAVPEPCSLALLVCGGLALARRRHR